MNERGLLVVVSGFSGAGKGTLMQELLARYDNYALSVSATTRSPRVGEKDGVQYFFQSVPEFEQMIREDAFIEYAKYVNNYYGTPKRYAEEQLTAGRDVILEIEIQGALMVKRQRPDTLLLFVTPPNARELERRLVGRGTESEDQIQGRLKRAVEEAGKMQDYDYVVINDDLEACVSDIHNIIRAQHGTVGHQQEFITKIQNELKNKEE